MNDEIKHYDDIIIGGICLSTSLNKAKEGDEVPYVLIKNDSISFSVNQIHFYNMVGCLYLSAENLKLLRNAQGKCESTVLVNKKINRSDFCVISDIVSSVEISYGSFIFKLSIRDFFSLVNQFIDLMDMIVSVEEFHVRDYDAIFLANSAAHIAIYHLDSLVFDNVYLSELKTPIIENGVETLVGVGESRVSRALHGDFRYVNAQKQINYIGYSNASRVNFVAEYIRKNGYHPEKGDSYIVLYDDFMRIQDGCHRASCLYEYYGDILVPVVRWITKDGWYTEESIMKRAEVSQKKIENRKQYVRDLLCRDLLGKKIIIKGAGQHTSELLQIMEDNFEIAGILGENNGSLKTKYPMMKKSDLQNTDADVILISSYMYRKEMGRELEEFGDKFEIYDIYNQGVLTKEFFS